MGSSLDERDSSTSVERLLRVVPSRTRRTTHTQRPSAQVGTLVLALVLIRVVSLHVVAVTPGAAGMPDRKELKKSSRAAARLDLLKWNAYQLGWDAMVPMALLGVPTAQ